MTVSELIKKLQSFNPDAVVFENRNTEYRELELYDVREGKGGEDDYLMTDDGDEFTGPHVTFNAWD